MQELRFPDREDFPDEFLQKFYQAKSDGIDIDKLTRRMDEDVPEGAEVVRRIRIGRNDKCPCGSGKKFKKCCIFKAKKI